MQMSTVWAMARNYNLIAAGVQLPARGYGWFAAFLVMAVVCDFCAQKSSKAEATR